MPHLLPAAASAIAAAAPAAAAGAAKAGVMATLKSVAFKAVTNLAISAALSALQPHIGGQGGRTFEWTIDPDAPIPFAAGRVGVAGSVVHRDTFGPDLMYYGIPAVLSGAGPITGYDSVKADDFTVTFDSSGKAITSTYAGELWFKSTLGNQPDVALSSPTGLKNGATLPGWTTAHKLSGKAAYMVVMGENSKGSAFPTGEIKPLITFRGLKGWDPRQDSTYPGGSGSCRLDDPSTWVYLTNPILWALKWSLGLWEGPTGKGAPQVDHQVGGIGAKLSGIDVPAFVAAANIADANSWTVSAYPNTDDDKHQVLEAFLQAGGAIYSQRAGKISCIQRAAPRTSIVTISAADTAGPLEIDTAASRIDRINTIRPRFWSPAHRWQMTAMDEVTAASYQTEDGGKRTRGIDYPFVSNAKQAGQLAALQIANTREGIAGVIPLKPHLQRIRPGDAFTITEAGFVLNGLKCLCLNTDYDPATGVVRVSFVSETDEKYPFALGQDPTPPEPQVLTPVDPGYVTPPQIGDWTIVPRPPAPGGGQLPGFDLGGIVSNETATSIIVEHGPTDDGPWTQAYEGPPTVTSIPIDGLQPGAFYYVAIRYRRDNNYSERYVYGPYQAPALVADDSVNVGGEPASQVLGQLANAEALVLTTALRVDELEIIVSDTQGEFNQALVLAEQYANASEDAATASDERATDAETAAGQALTYAGQSSDARDGAVTARIGSETAATTAQGTARDTGILPPFTVANLASYFTTAVNADPNRSDLPADRLTTTPEGPTIVLNATIGGFAAKGLFQHRPGRKIRVSARVKKLSGDVDLQMMLRGLAADYNGIGYGHTAVLPVYGNDVVSVVSTVFDFDAMPSGSVWERLVLTTASTQTIYVTGLWWEDVTSEQASANYAATSLTQAASATESAAQAQIAANVAASVGSGGGLQKDPAFQSWPVGNPLPDGWQNNSGSPTVTRDTTPANVIYGDHSLRMSSPATASHSLRTQTDNTIQNPTSDAASHYVVSYQVKLISGSFSRAGVQFVKGDGSVRRTYNLSFYDEHGAGEAGKTYSGQVMIPQGSASGNSTLSDWLVLTMDSATLSGPNTVAKDIVWSSVQIRPATAEEIAAGEAIPDLQAQAAILAGATADLQDQVGTAFIRLIAASGGNPASFEVRSSGGGSAISFRADTIAWGGNTVFDDATDQLTTITGSKARVLAFGAAFGTDGTLTQWEGPSNIAAGNRSRANAYFYVANVAPYIGGSAIATSDQARAKRTNGSISTSGSLALDFAGVTVGGVWEFSFGAYDPLSTQVAAGNSGNWAVYEQTTSQTGTQGTLLCSGRYTTEGFEPTVFEFASDKTAGVVAAGTRRVRLVLSGATDSGNITANFTAKYFPPAA